MISDLPQVSEFVLMKRTGHMTPVERPVDLADALVGLAESVGMPAPERESSAEPQTA
jgi:pimeloyl-ACP methyl ester carboxylesterase